MAETERMARAYAKLQRVARRLDTTKVIIDLTHNRNFWMIYTDFPQSVIPALPSPDPVPFDPLMIGFGGPELWDAIESIADEGGQS